VLQKQLAAGDLDKNPVNLRLYLTRVLGEFRTPVVLPALVEAAVTERDAEVERTTDPRQWFPKEIDVRRAAVESLAVLAGEESLGAETLRHDDDVMHALMAASREPTVAPDPNEDRAKLRQTAAYTLGVIGGDAACERLAAMLGDAFSNTRYNAAVGLARNGDPRAVEGLVEMLDPENEAAVASEGSDGEQYWKRGLIMMNALRAAKQLEQKNPQADLAALHGAAARLLQPKYSQKVHPEVLESAREMTQNAKRGV
jgi:HEAT repeat protein